jgi:hypothetical protein
MSDPQDLLYTNNYISTSVINNEKLLKEEDYYERFTDYLDKNKESDVDRYIDDDLNEESQINLNKTLRTKWPVDNKKNHYPLFDTFTTDVSTNRYKKEILTKVSIDSINRDKKKYSNPNLFTIGFQKVFNNVKKIILNDINFQNINMPVTNFNNCIAWQYPSENILVTYNIDYSIIPTPGIKKISYSSLPNSVYEYTTPNDEIVLAIDDYLVYQANIKPAFYTTESIVNNIRLETSKILHGQNSRNNSNNLIIEEPYLKEPNKIGNPHLFSVYIDPVQSIVRFVNRIEEIKIVAIQTFSPYENNFSETDIFYYYSSKYSPSTPVYSLDYKLIYITLEASSDTTYQYYENIFNLNYCNPFPLVITGLLNNVGDIYYDLLNYTAFFDLEIYLKNGYLQDELNSISYYKYFDTITITKTTIINGNTVTITNKYVRFALHLSKGNLNGAVYNNKGLAIKPVITENIIFSESLKSFYDSLNIYTNYYYNNIVPLIGRALLFRWIFDQYNNKYINYEIETLNEKKRSVLRVLAWPIANETNQIYAIYTNEGYGFIQSNNYSKLSNTQDLTSFETKANSFPSVSLNLQNFNNKYYFVGNSYIYLKIYFNGVSDTESNSNFLVSVSDQSILYNQVYVNSDRFNVGIGEDYTYIKECKGLQVLKKDNNGFLAKILLSNIPGNYDILNSNIINNNSYIINYDNVMDNVTSITIALFDQEFRLIEVTNDFSFTLNIHEIKDVLKETLINTKTNNVTSTGNFI